MGAFVVVVTGASSGISRDLAVNLAHKPRDKTGQAYHVVLVKPKKAVAECNEATGGKQVATYFAPEDQIDAAAHFAMNPFGRVNVNVTLTATATPWRAPCASQQG
jgi:NAD(P)-dependent dehydrogenase (short-subunit alcohol dehydrogenase family)